MRADRHQGAAFPRRSILAGAALLPLYAATATAKPMGAFGVREEGAKGDGETLDTAAIQRAIDKAAATGGTVYFPPGRYLSFSLHLKSHLTLLFSSGAVLVAADPARHKGRYDAPEPNQAGLYEDFGHNHWHNSLIWGEDIEDVAILGPGLIDGQGLTRESPDAPWNVGVGRNLPHSAALDARIAALEAAEKAMDGKGNKVIALKNSRNVTLRDFSIWRAGHFGVLVTGVDNITIDNLKIDTNRDGIDLDVVRNARLSNLTVNSPYDDAIVLKSSYGLGLARPTENVTITNCQVSGYDVGSLLDGSFRKSQLRPPLKHRTSGRIKLGTESTGGYRNIAVSNCVFDCCNGLALESLDGGVLEDVTVSNLVMRDTTEGPLFIRLGDRRRAPPGAPMAALRRVTIEGIDALCVDPRYPAIVSGVPGGLIEDVLLRDMRFVYPGGGTRADAALKPPEEVGTYPDPDMFGTIPAFGLYLRHLKGAVLRDIEMRTLAPDARPAVVTEDATGIDAGGVMASATPGGALMPVKL